MSILSFSDLGVPGCISCGAQGVPLYRIRGAASPDLRACAVCMDHFGEDSLAKESDRLLCSAVHHDVPRCLHCGEIVLMTREHKVPMWCQECERQRRQVAEAGRNRAANP